MQNDLVSIIVPVFNAEIFLQRCLDSIIYQTYQNLEIILVNDGSTDSSGNICDQYSEKDSRITIIHQENKGCNAARNIAIDRAQGKFIEFADSDDRLHHNTVERLHANITLKDAQLVLCGYQMMAQNNGILRTVYEPSADIGVEGMLEILSRRLSDPYGCSPWNKMFRADFLKENNLRFPSVISSGDFLFSISVYQSVKKITLTDEILYDYFFDTPHSVSKAVKNVEVFCQKEDRLYQEFLALYQYYGQADGYSAALTEFRLMTCSRKMKAITDAKTSDISTIAKRLKDVVERERLLYLKMKDLKAIGNVHVRMYIIVSIGFARLNMYRLLCLCIRLLKSVVATSKKAVVHWNRTC
jgi:glycosyltransferase involved in cell wall biosynthesis